MIVSRLANQPAGYIFLHNLQGMKPETNTLGLARLNFQNPRGWSCHCTHILQRWQEGLCKGGGAVFRHTVMEWRPRLQIKGQSITCSNRTICELPIPPPGEAREQMFPPGGGTRLGST